MNDMVVQGGHLQRQAASRRIVSAQGSDYLGFNVFPGGTMLVTSSIEVAEPTEICFAQDENGQHISAQYFLSGEASIIMGNGHGQHWTQDGTSVIRSDTPGFRLIVKPGQVLRHVCVAMYRHDLKGRLDETSCPQLARLMAADETVDLAVPVPTDMLVRSTAQRLYQLRAATGLGSVRAEGLAISFLSEVLFGYGQLALDDADTSSVLPWQAHRVRQLKAAIDADPGHSFAEGEMLERFGMGDQMARRVFQEVFGTTLAAYTRTVRLAKAQAALRDGTTSVKQIGFACGYAHIGNFTRAYKQHFGETPSDTRARAAQAR